MKTAKIIAVLAICTICVVALIGVFAATIDLVESGQNLGDGRTFSIALGDVDGDDDLDAFITSYLQSSKVWINDGNGTFSDSGQSLGAATGHGVALGKLDTDNNFDAFLLYNV